MARRRTTFGKLQRARDKQAKAQAKIERRQTRSAGEAGDEEDEADAPVADQEKVLAELAELHRAFDDDELSLDDFESRKQELTNQLRID